MPQTSSSKSTLPQLNAARRQAVELRLAGQTLAATQTATGLSNPTIISAMKAYKTGGWDAVNVAPRGRPRRSEQQANSATEELRVNLFKQCVLPPSTRDALHTQSLMNVERFESWLSTQNHTVSRSAQLNLLSKWNLQPQNRYRSLRDRVDLQSQHPNSTTWLDEHDQFAVRAKRQGASVFWVATRAIDTEYTQIFAHDLRGRTHWCLVRGAATADHYQQFLKSLNDLIEKPLALVFTNHQLPRIAQLKQWLAETHTSFFCVDESGDARNSRTQSSHSTSFQLNPGSHMTKSNDAAAEERPSDISADTLTHLQRLEAESIHIMREVVAEAENPVMMYSVGKDSAVMLHLARKAFYPAPPPFPLLHVDTTWKFKAMYEFRDNIVEKYGLELLKHVNPEGIAQNVNPFTHGSALHTDIMKTQGLKQALNEHKFDFAFGGARRDEEKSRAKERVFSFRNAQHRWDAKKQRPELWKLYNARKAPDESIRVFPISNWTELDIWQYIHKEDIPIVPLYLAAERPVVERDGTLIMVDDERMPLKDGEVPQMRSVRFRTLGCYPLTGAVESTATTLPEIIQEMLLTRTSERQGRMIDHDSSASMEKKKQEGYF